MLKVPMPSPFKWYQNLRHRPAVDGNIKLENHAFWIERYLFNSAIIYFIDQRGEFSRLGEPLYLYKLKIFTWSPSFLGGDESKILKLIKYFYW